MQQVQCRSECWDSSTASQRTFDDRPEHFCSQLLGAVPKPGSRKRLEALSLLLTHFKDPPIRPPVHVTRAKACQAVGARKPFCETIETDGRTGSPENLTNKRRKSWANLGAQQATQNSEVEQQT